MGNERQLKRLLFVSIFLLIAVTASACGDSGADPTGFEGGPGMLYFYSPDCPVCQGMKPIIDRLEGQYGDEFKFVRVNVDTDRGKEQARAHGLIGQPAYLLFDASEQEVRRLMGANTRATLEEAILRAMGSE